MYPVLHPTEHCLPFLTCRTGLHLLGVWGGSFPPKPSNFPPKSFPITCGVVWISSKVYTSRIANTVEVSVYLNLIILSALSTNSVVSAKLFNTLVSLVFVTMLGIIIYHFHLLYIAQSAMWTKMKDWMKHIISKPHMNPPPDTEVTSTPHNVPSTSVIELREHLLDN